MNTFNRTSLAFVLLGLLALATPARAQSDGIPVNVLPNFVPGGTSVTVALGYIDYSGIYFIVAPQPRPPVNVGPDTTLTLTTGYDETTIQSVKWMKDGVPLPSTASKLYFPNPTESDSGTYTAAVTIGGVVKPTDFVIIRVSNPPRQQLLNLSSRTTISPANPTLIGGFVINRSPGQLNESKQLLIRAVGPSLASHGVEHPLLHPSLRLFRSDGSEVSLFNPAGAVPYFPYYEQVTGAFPLGSGTDDAAALVTLPAGVYSAHASAKDGGTGDVLLEIYEVPSSALQLGLAIPSNVTSAQSGGK